MKEVKKIYPEEYGRINCLASMYASIAIENYFYANECYKKLCSYEWICGDSLNAELAMDKHCITSIVFSVMCIESFLNNYAATCLGDDVFYRSFDQLSAENKLSLITTFLFGIKFDRSKSYYSRLKHLVKLRNSYIHNKSENFFDSRFYKENKDREFIDLENPEDSPDEQTQAQTPNDCSEHRRDVQNARNGVATIRDIALFFDENDANARAILLLFNPDVVKITNPGSPADIVLKELNIEGVGLA